MSSSSSLSQVEIEKPYVPPAWAALTTHLNRWFHKPDLEALEVALCAVGAHPAITGDPCWLFVQGPSGSGKTAIIINALCNLPHAVICSEVNRHAFLSFYRGEKGGLLVKIGSSGILLFKDLTTLLSKREDERAEVISHLREIYDGRFVRNVGTGESDWTGRVTCIAACTPALEKAWSFKRDLGERFLTVRWGRDGSIEMATTAAKQRGHEHAITTTTRELGAKMLANPLRSIPQLPPHLALRVGALAQLVAELRVHVEHLRGRNEVSDVAMPEEPSRVNKSLSALAGAHAALWKHDPPNEDDFRIAKRVAFDSIPSRRLQILHCFANPESDKLGIVDIGKRANLTASIVTYYLEELTALEALELTTSALGDKYYQVTPKLLELLERIGTKRV